MKLHIPLCLRDNFPNNEITQTVSTMNEPHTFGLTKINGIQPYIFPCPLAYDSLTTSIPPTHSILIEVFMITQIEVFLLWLTLANGHPLAIPITNPLLATP